MKKLVGTLVVAATLESAPFASAEEYVCTGIVGEATLDNVVVPQRARCVLEGTFVEGTIKVKRRATLLARGVRVVGNVQGENAANVAVTRRSRIGGSVQVVQGMRGKVRGSRINADILFDENDRYVRIRRNRVGGNVQVFQNDGGAEIFYNRIDGNLQCKENVPAPTGGGNVVQGNKEDQCATF